VFNPDSNKLQSAKILYCTDLAKVLREATAQSQATKAKTTCLDDSKKDGTA